ncbi:MAG TPA: ABC transporter ATP-binding protein [Baekduia sp.]|nr:ABC transporter ATP-binding protein [Baekduia sp.]
MPASGAADAPAPGAAGQGVRVDGICRRFDTDGDDLLVLDTTSFEVQAGEFVTILGPSGCGKSTLFNMVAGLLAPSSGDIYVHGERVTGRTGSVSYMMQRDLLLPWRSVLDNVILGMETAGMDRKKARAEASLLLDRFGLGRFAKAYPAQLSGGMRQRAAFIRTMLFPRGVLLLDEPLGALDAQTRLLMQEWLLEIWGEERKTVLFITHDVDEAVFLSDRVHVMSARPGRIIDEVKITLPRPRSTDLRTTPEFTELRNRLLTEIHRESLKAFEQGAV